MITNLWHLLGFNFHSLPDWYTCTCIPFCPRNGKTGNNAKSPTDGIRQNWFTKQLSESVRKMCKTNKRRCGIQYQWTTDNFLHVGNLVQLVHDNFNRRVNPRPCLKVTDDVLYRGLVLCWYVYMSLTTRFPHSYTCTHRFTGNACYKQQEFRKVRCP